MSWSRVAGGAVLCTLAVWNVGWAQVDTAAAAATGVYFPSAPEPLPAETSDTAAAQQATPLGPATGDTTAPAQAAPPAATTTDTSAADTALPDTTAALSDTARAAATARSVQAAPPARPRVDSVPGQAAAPAPARESSADTSIQESTSDTSLTARMDARRGGGLVRGDFPDLRSSAEMTGRYRVLLELAARTRAGSRLATDSAITLLAPTDSAFARLPAPAIERLRADSAYRERWIAGLLVRGTLNTEELVKAGSVRVQSGNAVTVLRGADRAVRVGEARVVQPDLAARNGVLHGTDRVILPDTTSASP
jgi:uncharacterized surface protein with fasciclin (FAS1) repeats